MIRFYEPRPQPVMKNESMGHVSKNVSVPHLRKLMRAGDDEPATTPISARHSIYQERYCTRLPVGQ